MARTHNSTRRRNKTQQRENGRNKKTGTPHKHQNIEDFFRCHPILRKIQTEPFRKDQHYAITIEKRNKMELNRRTQYRLQQNKTRTNISSVPSPLQRKLRKYRHYRRM